MPTPIQFLSKIPDVAAALEPYLLYQRPVISDEQTTAPGAPVNFDRYVAPTNATGGWIPTYIYEYKSGSWTSILPRHGMTCRVMSGVRAGRLICYNENTAAWEVVSGGSTESGNTALTTPVRWYVDSLAGNDENTGSSSDPLKLLEFAIAQLRQFRPIAARAVIELMDAGPHYLSQTALRDLIILQSDQGQGFVVIKGAGRNVINTSVVSSLGETPRIYVDTNTSLPTDTALGATLRLTSGAAQGQELLVMHNGVENGQNRVWVGPSVPAEVAAGDTYELSRPQAEIIVAGDVGQRTLNLTDIRGPLIFRNVKITTDLMLAINSFTAFSACETSDNCWLLAQQSCSIGLSAPFPPAAWDPDLESTSINQLASGIHLPGGGVSSQLGSRVAGTCRTGTVTAAGAEIEFEGRADNIHALANGYIRLMYSQAYKTLQVHPGGFVEAENYLYLDTNGYEPAITIRQGLMRILPGTTVRGGYFAGEGIPTIKLEPGGVLEMANLPSGEGGAGNPVIAPWNLGGYVQLYSGTQIPISSITNSPSVWSDNYGCRLMVAP
jgi:hypothetical protein